MKLKKKVINRIKVPAIRIKMAGALKCTEQWIIKLIEANKANGPLTTASVLKVIREETGLTDSEILEEEKDSVKA